MVRVQKITALNNTMLSFLYFCHALISRIASYGTSVSKNSNFIQNQ